MMKSIVEIEHSLYSILKPYGISVWVLTAYDRDALIIRLHHLKSDKVQIIDVNRYTMRELQDLNVLKDMVMSSSLIKTYATKWHKKNYG